MRTFLICLVALTAFGCSDNDRGAAGSAASSGGSGGAGAISGVGGSGGTTNGVDAGAFPTNPEGQVLCGTAPCKCHNGIDDDGDGFVDGADAECTGPYDDDEGTFATGIPGDNIDFCQDCFFDGNSGAGDDGCAYHTDCLYGEAPSGQGNSDCHDCDVTTECVNFCKARTPNGCDCFGCCGVQDDDGTVVNVILAATCSVEDLDDETKCPRCTPTTNDCYNECGRCELCLGKGPDDLPGDCYGYPPDASYPDSGYPDSGAPMYPPQTCDEGQTPCDQANPCGPDHYCQQGCCLIYLD